MTSELPLRPVVVAVATAVGCFVAANVAIYFLLFRPVPAAPAAAPPANTHGSAPLPCFGVSSAPAFDTRRVPGGSVLMSAARLSRIVAAS